MANQQHDYQSEQFKHWMKGLLNEGNVRVVFTKADGTDREMLCTLKADSIPQSVEAKEKGTRRTSEEAQAVFDVDKQAWRSFRWDSIKEFSFTL